jgi:hypothetical protein
MMPRTAVHRLRDPGRTLARPHPEKRTRSSGGLRCLGRLAAPVLPVLHRTYVAPNPFFPSRAGPWGTNHRVTCHPVEPHFQAAGTVTSRRPRPPRRTTDGTAAVVIRTRRRGPHPPPRSAPPSAAPPSSAPPSHRRHRPHRRRTAAIVPHRRTTVRTAAIGRTAAPPPSATAENTTAVRTGAAPAPREAVWQRPS